MAEFTVDSNGRPMQGPTGSKPTNPFTGEVYFDITVGISLVWNGTAWCAGSFLGGADDIRPAATGVAPGTPFLNVDGTVLQISDGAAWLDAIEEDGEESSTSSHSSST